VSFRHGVSEAADEGQVSEPSPQTPVVDLNSDLGEGFGIWTLGDDDALLDIVTSANVACGFHAGDPNILRRVCEKAVSRGVVIGAQVSYQDLAGFGRRSMDVDAATLTNDVIYQIAALDGFARVAGSKVRYVKPHGALYNRTVHDQDQAAAVVAALIAYDPSLPLLGLPGSALLRVADKAGLRTVTEAFADRGYTAQATLVPRSQPGALLHDPAEVAQRMVGMLITGRVLSVDGVEIAVSARSICVHGDTPGAVAMAVAVRKALAEAGVEIRAFAL
jgi:5-oxoprolinase (ATP-hydrolysing) subunit A